MPKCPKLDITKYKNWARLNPISKSFVNDIQKKILALSSFNAKIYPQGSIFSYIDYRIRAKKLTKEWILKWYEMFEYYINIVVDTLMPQIKQQIREENFKDDYLNNLIISTVETEFFSMLYEIVDKYLDDIPIYYLMNKLESTASYLSSGDKIESSN